MIIAGKSKLDSGYAHVLLIPCHKDLVMAPLGNPSYFLKATSSRQRRPPKPNFQELIDAQPLKELRTKRNPVLDETDKYIVADYPHATPEARQTWLEYRQALRRPFHSDRRLYKPCMARPAKSVGLVLSRLRRSRPLSSKVPLTL